jgi:hypothetical protein
MGKHVTESVGGEGDARLQEGEYLPYGRSYGAIRRPWPDVPGARTTSDLGEVAQMGAFGGVEVERVGEGVDDRTGRVAVAALFDSGEVLDADSGP